jgi:long-chain acyl-CoA synthetase
LLHKAAGKQLKKLFGGRMRLFAIGGAKFDPEAELFLKDAGFPYGIGYGLTETAPLVAGCVGNMVRIGSTGPALKGVDIRLDDINSETGQGEIVVKTPCCMKGYYKNEEATQAAFTEDGWFRTGDLGAMDKDGRIYIKGRLKNMIVGPSGENIYPEDIEEVLNSNRLVAESVVLEEDGKLIALVHFDTTALEEAYDEFKYKMAVSKEQAALKMEEIKRDVMNYVNSKVNRFSKISKVVDNEGEFEKTPTKKIRRFIYNRKDNKSENNPKA